MKFFTLHALGPTTDHACEQMKVISYVGTLPVMLHNPFSQAKEADNGTTALFRS